MPPLELELLEPPDDSTAGTPARLRFKPAKLEYFPYTQPSLSESSQPAGTQANIQTHATRLHEIVQRIGEICLSPELAQVMLFPPKTLLPAQAQSFPQSFHDLCHDPPAILAAMANPLAAKINIPDATRFLQQFQSECLPQPTTVTLRQPLHVCAWRLESPSRVLLLSGSKSTNAIVSSQDLENLRPHTLPKLLLDERSKRPTPSTIHLLAPDADLTQHGIRASLLHYARTTPLGLSPLPATGAPQDSDTTLEEAAYVFTARPAANHSEIPLNTSPPWDKNHIDSRYAETQTATNGLRYRDWLAVYASDETIEKCKLEGHILDVARFHQAITPWKRHNHPSTQNPEWCVSRSSLPLEQRILHDRPPPTTADPTTPANRFAAFTRSVKARLLQDLKLLPVPDEKLFHVERHNVTVYTDEPSQQILVVYAPTPLPDASPTNSSLEFVAFTLLPPHHE